MLMQCPFCRCEGPFVTDGVYCSYCGAKLEERTEPIRHTLYLHSSSDSTVDEGEELGLTGEALKMFCRAGYEVGLVLEVDPETGKANMIGVEDVVGGITVVIPLARAVEI